MSELLTPDRLLDFFAGGHRPREQWKLGLEYEQFVTDRAGLPLPYSGKNGVAEMLEHLREWTGWKPLLDGEHMVGLKSDRGAALTLEPGAQLEFNTPAVATVGELEAEVAAYFGMLRRLREEYGTRFLALGAHPLVGPDDIERIPKARYDIMEPYLQSADELGIWMMKATCGIQVNFDHGDAEDAARKMRVGFMLAPVFTALFAKSPLRAGEFSGYMSWRGHVWTKTDPQRCGIPESCTRPDSTLTDYVEWALDAPMMFVQREGKFVDMRGRNFREYLRDGAHGQSATDADWDLHLSSVFPEVRFRPQLELRSLDSHCPPWSLALCALAKGVFYDNGALQAAEKLTAHWSHEERLAALDASHRHALAGVTPDGRTLLHYARELVEMAVLSEGEQKFLEPLRGAIASGRSQAERMMHRLETEWNGDLQRLVESVRCLPEEEAQV